MLPNCPVYAYRKVNSVLPRPVFKEMCWASIFSFFRGKLLKIVMIVVRNGFIGIEII